MRCGEEMIKIYPGLEKKQKMRIRIDLRYLTLRSERNVTEYETMHLMSKKLSC